MSPFARLFLLFALVPLVELYLLIQVGLRIGAVPTILLVLITASVGAAMMRHQGLQTWAQVQTATARGELPAVPLLEGLCLLVAGALLLTPGFFTDTLGFLLLVPELRRRLIRRYLHRLDAHMRAATGTGPGGRQPPRGDRGGRIIEGEFEHRDRD